MTQMVQATESGLGSTMRAARIDRGLGLRELAREVGMSPSSLSEFERGRSRPGPPRLAALSAALDVPLEPSVAEPLVPAFRHWREFEDVVLEPVAQASLELFVERGFDGATMRMIAGRCGMTVAGVYHHAASKHELLMNLMRAAMGDMAARCAAAVTEAESPGQRLSNVVECLVLYHVRRRDWGFLATNEIRALEGPARDEVLAERRRVRAFVQDAVEGCRDQSFLAGSVSREVAARAIVTMCVAIPGWYNDAGQPPPQQIVDEYVALASSMATA